MIHQLHPGAGKAEVEIARTSQGIDPAPGTPAYKRNERRIFHIILRDEIERGDPRRFLDSFCPAAGVQRMQQVEGKISVTVVGYEDREEELYEVAEVREFFTRIHRLWPCWLFLGGVSDQCLRTVALSIVPRLAILRRAEEGCVHVQTQNKDMIAFFTECLPAAAFLDNVAKVSRRRGANRIGAIAKYLGVTSD